VTALEIDAKNLQADIQKLVRSFEELYIGKRVRITQPFHDQPFGKSRPNLEGKTYVIERVSADTFGVSLALAGVRMMIQPDEVEVL
jgi:hypothetical protein